MHHSNKIAIPFISRAVSLLQVSAR